MAGLDSSDSIVGGAGTKDYVTATAVTGLTATTGKLNIQDIETVELKHRCKHNRCITNDGCVNACNFWCNPWYPNNYEYSGVGYEDFRW